MAFTQKLFTSYQPYLDGDTRIGELYRIWYDSNTNTLRIQLDDTPGGTIISGGGGGGGYILPTASTTVKGGVKIDGTTITINNQVISGFSGNYNDLSNKPTIPAAQVNADWNSSSGLSEILNKPILFSGSYNDLTDTPSIPAAQIQSDWNQTNNTLLDYIKNKPTIPDITEIENALAATGEPMGHTDRTQSVMSFDDASRTFSISPIGESFEIWTKGTRRIITDTRQVTIPDTTGLYYIYFDTAGVLQYRTTFFDWPNDCMTAYVYWNDQTNDAPFVADERHGITLDWQTHEYLHRTRGAAIANGFDATNYIVLGDGSLNTHMQLDISSGTFFDEDLQVDIVDTNTPTPNTWDQDLTGPAKIPMFYINSGGGWVIDAPTNFPIKQGTLPKYNLYSDGVWTTPDIDNNKFGVTFIVATNNINYPVIGIIGQAQRANIGDAEATEFSDLNLAGFPVVEMRLLYKLVYECKDNYANSVNARLVSIWDQRSFESTTSAIATYTDHGALGGLVDDDHPQYLLRTDAASTYLTSADAGSLTGTTLKSTVINSSLTSVGTLTGLTSSGTVTINSAGGLGYGAGQLYINGATYSRIDFGEVYAAPVVNGRSTGSRLIFNPGTGLGRMDSGIGMSTTTLWNSVQDPTFGFGWYAGDGLVAGSGSPVSLMTLTGSGNLTIKGNLTAQNLLTSTTSASIFNTTATTLNIGGAATTLNLSASSGTTTINNNLSMASGKTIGTTGSVTANAATAFVAGDNAASGVALQIPQEGALRNLTNGSTNMYFDVSIGGGTQGQFQFRSSSSYTNVLTMSPTGVTFNTDATVTARTPSVARTAFNSAIDTEITVDNMRFRISNQGGIFPQVIGNGSSRNLAWTGVGAISGSAVNQVGSVGTIVASNAWTTLYNLHGMDNAGDTVTVTLQDKAAGRIYRITFMRSDNGSTTGYNIIGERLL